MVLCSQTCASSEFLIHSSSASTSDNSIDHGNREVKVWYIVVILVHTKMESVLWMNVLMKFVHIQLMVATISSPAG